MSAATALAQSAGTAATGLAALEASVARALRYLGDDPPNWVPLRAGVDHDVVIVGGGQTGVTTAFALRRAGISKVSVIDADPRGLAGTWARRARMKTLRTPKKISGPELGIPELSFPAWYEAQHGDGAFAEIERISTPDWADYVAWYQKMVRVDVRHDTSVTRICADGDCLRVETLHQGKTGNLRARKVVLAMGMVGAGVPNIPEHVPENVPAERYAHTDDVIDFAALRGKRVAVVGAASSAFDAAGVSLENGAAGAHLFCRGADLARVAREWPLGYPGAGNNFGWLSDADRWHLGRVLRARAPGPMPDTVRRATCHPNFRLHLNAAVDAVTYSGSELTVSAGEHRFAFDFIIFGTGYKIDAAAHPILSDIAPHIATWGDRYEPPAALDHPPGARYPYLGGGYEFQERVPGSAPFVRDIHCFNFAAIMSFGRTVGDIASLQSGVPRLVSAVSRDLFLGDRDHHLARLTATPALELTGEEYRHSVWSSRAYAG